MLLISAVDGLATYVLLGVHEPQDALRMLDLKLAHLFGDAGEGAEGQERTKGRAGAGR